MKSPNPKASSYHHGNLRRELLRAAEQELQAKGLKAFSLRSVARRAGVSHNAPAHHFADVQGLLTGLAAVGFERLVMVQSEQMAMAPDSDPEQFMALGLGYIKFATQYPALFKLMYSSTIPDRKDPVLAAAMRETLDGLRRISPATQSPKGDIAPEDFKSILAAWSMVHGFAELINSGLIEGVLSATGQSQEELAKDVLSRLVIR